MTTNLYHALKESGIPLDHHESDLYAKSTPDSRRIVQAYGHKWTTFIDAKDGKIWLDLPFAYWPYWEAKLPT